MTHLLDFIESFEQHQVEVAAIISRLAHKDQMWGSESFYTAHIVPTVKRIEEDERSNYDLMSIGFLMNAVNETELSLEDCVTIGFTPMVLESLHILSMKVDEDFFEYIMRLAECPICRFIKLHELRARLEKTSEKKGEFKKYTSAIAALEGYSEYTFEEGIGDRPRIN